MSHALVLVALTPEQAKDVNAGVEWNLSPFDENGAWFAEGSRWDYWMIGGRWEGFFGDGSNVKKRKELVEENFGSAFAFVCNRVWQEKARMGWWGMTAKTECELIGKAKKLKRCLVKKDGWPGKIVSWGDEDKEWSSRFWSRFIRALPSDTVLVAVDYHV